MTLEGEEEPGKLFVGGLSWETSVEKLQDYFCHYGEVADCIVMKNAETGRSRGFGFVTYKDPNCVQLVLSSGPHSLDGRTIDPKACNAKSAQKGKKEAKTSNYPKIFLGGLPPNVNETVLRDHFSQYGQVMEVVIMYDQERKKTRGNGFRGFGFLSFENDEAVNKVVAEHYVTINGKKVEVKKAEPRERHPRSGPQQNNQQQDPRNQQNPMAHWWAPQPVGPPGMPGPPPHGHPGPPPPGQPPAPAAPNGVMPQAGYPGWGAAPPGPGQVPGYGPPAGWTAPPTGYQGYQNWGAGYGYPPQGWNNQQGYPYASAYPANYPGYGQPPVPVAATPTGAPPTNPNVPPAAGTPAGSTPSYGPQTTLQPPPPQSANLNTPITQTSMPTTTQPQPVAPQSAGNIGNYAQDASSYGPARLYGGYAAAAAIPAYSSTFPGSTGEGLQNSSTPTGGYGAASTTPQLISSSYNRNATTVQGYHPYRRM